MNKQEIILMYLRDHKSKRAIARETGLARKTVEKYINEYEKNLVQLGIGSTDEVNRQELIKELTDKPQYSSTSRFKPVVTDKLIERIQYYLDENKEKRLTGLSKQQKKKTDIYEALLNDGFHLSYATVLRTANKLEAKAQEAYIRQEYVPGNIVEFDWGNVKLETEHGIIRNYQMAVFTAAYSNFRWAKLFPKQDTQCFIEAHSDFFEYTGGAFAQVVYDNMKIAVRKFISKTEKEPTEELLKLSLYYRFKFRFCNIRSGNEKGHVERSVEVVRRKAFSNKDTFASLDEANEYLQQVCEKLNSTVQINSQKSPLDLFLEEKPTLLPTFGKYEAAKIELLRVDKYSTIMVDSCHYSVPDRLVNKIVKCKIYSNDIIVFFDNEKVAHHKKNHGKFQWIIDVNHYITTLMRKPHALLNSSAFNQMNKDLEEIYSRYFTDKDKDFVQLLALVGDVGLDKVEKSISMISKITPTSITIDKIKFVCQRNETIDFYKDCLNDKESKIVNNSVNMLNDYTEMLSERKDDVN